MKILFPVFLMAIILLSCNNSSNTAPVATPGKDTAVKQRFFPVTPFLKGEIHNLKADGINPKKYTTINGHTDSVWLKVEEFDTAFYEFIHPEIDSANLITLFTETGFLDQSIHAFTFTYDPTLPPLPDSMQLQHWDVYINPDNNKVKRIYMIKQVSKNKTLQLTWVSNQWCKTTTIITDEAGVSKIEKEEKVFWDF
ncbi:MAG: hypothetical protein ABIO79_06895 [Ferruginibacter sp.]